MLQLMIRTRNLHDSDICGQVASSTHLQISSVPPCLHQTRQLEVEILIGSSRFSSHNTVASKENEPFSSTSYPNNTHNKRNGMHRKLPNNKRNDDRMIFLNEWSFMDAHRGQWDLYASLIMDETNTTNSGCNILGSTWQHRDNDNHVQNQGFCNHGGYRQCFYLIPRREDLIVRQCQEWPYWQYLGECEPSIMRMEIQEKLEWLNVSMFHEESSNHITTYHWSLNVFMDSVHSYYYCPDSSSNSSNIVPKINRRTHGIGTEKNGSSSSVGKWRGGDERTKAERAIQITDGLIHGVHRPSLQTDGQQYPRRQRDVSSRSRPQTRLNKSLQSKQDEPTLPTQQVSAVKEEIYAPKPSSFYRSERDSMSQVLDGEQNDHSVSSSTIQRVATHDTCKSFQNNRHNHKRLPIKRMGKVHHHTGNNMVYPPRSRPRDDRFTSKSKRHGQNGTASSEATTKLFHSDTRDDSFHANDTFTIQDRTTVTWRSILWE
jgi:hypothetical protein